MQKFSTENHGQEKKYSTFPGSATDVDYERGHTTLSPIQDEVPLMQKIFPTGFKRESKRMAVVIVPVIITNSVLWMLFTETSIVCSVLPRATYDGILLAISMSNCFGIVLNAGLVSACDTLFAQTYGSAHKKRMGVFLQQSLIIMNLIQLILWSFHMNVEPLFLLLGQIPEVARISASYMRILMPGTMFQVNYLILTRYLQNQDITFPPMMAGIIGNIFNITSQYVVIRVLGFGFEASAICLASSYAIMLLGNLIYIFATKVYRETWSGWKRDCLFNWNHILRLAVPGACHICLESLAYEGCIFASGLLGEAQLAAMSIMVTIEGTAAYIMPNGFSVAANIRVGQYLGANNPLAAKTAQRVCHIYGLIGSLIFACFFTGMKDVIPLLFTSDEEIIALISESLPLLAVCLIPETLMVIGVGVMKGCGRQKIVANSLLLTYYVFGVPLAFTLAFAAKLGIVGFWTGLINGNIFLTIFLGIKVFRLNWAEEAILSQERLAAASRPKKSELTPLLKTAAVPAKVKHLRTPSEPLGCSTDFPPLPTAHEHVDHDEFIAILKKRLTIVFLILIFFCSAICLHVFLPTELYRPAESVNTTLTTFEPILAEINTTVILKDYGHL